MSGRTRPSNDAWRICVQALCRIPERKLLDLLDDTWVVGDLGCGTGQLTEAIAPCVARVIGVDEAGPAAKAGIEEGSRIASINGVDVRGKNSEDDEFMIFRSSSINRFEREINKLKPGDDATLRVVYNGQARNVTVKVARASDLPRRGRSMTIIGGDNYINLPPVSANVNIDGERIGETVRRAIESARTTTNGALAGVGRVMAGFGNRVSW